jgi:DNA modification methylase
MVPVENLKPYERNPRTHSPEQVEAIARSLDEFGWTNPILIGSDGSVIAGHGRLAAAKLRGHASVPCIELVRLTEAQRRAYIIADNQLALRAGWDDNLLRLELDDLRLDFDLSVIGFTDAELASILDTRPTGNTDPDDVPEPPVNPISRTGDLWTLGRHQLLCGDSTVADNVVRVLGEVRPHLMVTDPPYGVEYDPAWRDGLIGSIRWGNPKTTARGKVSNDDNADWRGAWVLFPGEVAYVWYASMFGSIVADGLAEAGFGLRSQIIWVKEHFTFGRSDYHWQHETCWYAVKKGKTGHWANDRKQTTVWHIGEGKGCVRPTKDGTGHGTQKPVECMKRPIENNSSPGQAVYEPFSGSGTTIIAAEMTGRACHAIEISPVYIDVAIERWQNFTGQKATLDGKPWDEVQNERKTKAPASAGDLGTAVTGASVRPPGQPVSVVDPVNAPESVPAESAL